MLSFKLKRLCSSVIASLTAIGVFSFNNAKAADYAVNSTFKISSPKTTSFTADYTASTCQAPDNGKVIGDAAGTTVGGVVKCTYACNDGYAIPKKFATNGDTGTGLYSFYTGGSILFPNRIQVSLASGKIAGLCQPIGTGRNDLQTGVGVTGGETIGWGTGLFGTANSEWLENNWDRPSDLKSDVLGYTHLYAKVGCLAGYGPQGKVEMSGVVGRNDQYSGFAYAEQTTSGLAITGTIQCYPVSYPVVFDCVSGTVTCPSGIKDADKCVESHEYKSDVRISASCTRQGYKFGGWNLSN